MSKDFNKSNFYKECEDLFHEYASGVGYATDGAKKVPDLMPKRELFVATLLDDKSLSDACGNDPAIYYYNVIRYCLTAGIEYGAQWLLAPDGFDEENYDGILYRNNVGRSSSDIKSEISPSPEAWKQFLIGLHRVWAAQMKPYLSNDPVESTEHLDNASEKSGGDSTSDNIINPIKVAPSEASSEVSEAVMQSCMAVFQLGVSIAFQKFDE